MLLYTGLYYFNRDKGEKKSTLPILSYFLYVIGCMLCTDSRIISHFCLPLLAKNATCCIYTQESKNFLMASAIFF